MNLDFTSVPSHTFSANEIKQYSDCARKRYYASRDCLAIRSTTVNSNLELGKAFHKWLQVMYTDCDIQLRSEEILNPTYEEAERVFNSINDSFSIDLDEESARTLQAMQEGYKEQLINDLVRFEVIDCEHEFNMNHWPVADVRYHGQIDMIVQDRENRLYYFFEHKTCKDFRPEIYNRFDIQLHIYHCFGKALYEYAFGGIILNEVKKAKTARGYAAHRMLYQYPDKERSSFVNWLTKKTIGAISPENQHEPCNNYMTCKMCEYASICLKYGYEAPSRDQVLEDFPEDFAVNLREDKECNSTEESS